MFAFGREIWHGGAMDESTTFGRWAVVESALVRAFRIPKKDLSRFRARLTVLQRGGLLGRENQVGRGTAIAYGADEVRRLILAIALMEAGLPPSAVLKIVKNLWTQEIAEHFEQVVLAGENVFLGVSVSLMTGGWSHKRLPLIVLVHLTHADADHAAGLAALSETEQLIVLDVGKRWREFEAALKQGDKDEKKERLVGRRGLGSKSA
jgi:hypothetical protein